MLTSDFDYQLPEELIAERPRRGASHLMELPPQGGLRHHLFADLPRLLEPGDLLVFNDTRVLPARLLGHRLGTDGEPGGGVEALLVEPSRTAEEGEEREEGGVDHGAGTAASRWWAMLRPGRRQRPGQELVFGPLRARVVSRNGGLFELDLDAGGRSLIEALEQAGRLPLPPYIGREADERDNTDYQTIFARRPGAVAAPTAGLHFDESLMDALSERGIAHATVTLHVGPGTFRPVQSREVEEHVMDSERFHLGGEVVEAIEETRARGGRVVAVGTTVVRTLEGRALAVGLEPGRGRTDLFITPGHRFHVVDGLVTNFHLPRSTLVMLVAALAGRERLLKAYRTAVEKGYRFYSYGDAMLVWPRRGGGVDRAGERR